MALVINAAAADPGQHEFLLFRVAKIEVNLDTAERSGDLINDPRNEFFQVEGGGNALREFLQPHQFRYSESSRFMMLSGRAEIHERAGGHDKTSWRSSADVVYKIAKISFPILFLCDL